MTAILRSQFLSQFACLGDKCEDTCCQGWSMQMDEPTLKRYREEAPELLSAVEPSTESPWIMRKNADGFCVKLEGGLCGIHKTHGAGFLGDACYFYPRVTRRLGEQVVMTAAMSCPEITRLALFGNEPCALIPGEAERLPHSLKNYLPEGMNESDALSVHRAFLQAAEDSASAEQIFLRIASVSRFLERIDRKTWAQAVPFYLKNADTQLPAAQAHDADPFNLLHALCGLIVASHKKPSARLMQTVSDMEKALAVTLDWQNAAITLSDRSADAYTHVASLWQREGAAMYAPVLKRWLQMQLSLAFFPYGGLGQTLAERATIIGVRLATIKLALSTTYSIFGSELPQEVVVRVLQSLSRFMDHLGDPSFSLQIYKETGWDKEARMRGLLRA